MNDFFVSQFEDLEAIGGEKVISLNECNCDGFEGCDYYCDRYCDGCNQYSAY